MPFTIYRLRQDPRGRTLGSRCQDLRKSGISETRARVAVPDDGTHGDWVAENWRMGGSCSM
jgi:hypothetical protein